MKVGLWFAVGVGVTLAVAAAVLMGGWLLWVGRVWERPMLQGTELGGAPCEDPAVGWGPSRMMGGWSSAFEPALCPLGDGDEAETPLDTDEAQHAFERYVATLGYEDLLVVEVMEFEHNYYAIVEESESGVGAMELLLDKTTGAVGPEMGPNTMWNTKYGMHRRGMMGRWQDEALSEAEALEIAQAWLDARDSGVAVEQHADPFYGYYTIHTERDGEIEGMLSIHATTGQVWYHTWHGDFVRMVEHQEEGATDY